MKIIKELAGQMRSELHDADKYAKLAMQYKDSDNDLADMYYNLGKQELDHANIEHKQVVRLIQDSQSRGIQPPPGMLEMWEWEHEQLIEEQRAATLMLDMFRK